LFSALAALALLAIAVRAPLPAGFMLAATPHGELTAVAFCVEHHAIEPVFGRNDAAPLDGDRDIPADQPGDDPHHAAAPCIFSWIAALGPHEQDLSTPIGVSRDHADRHAPAQFAVRQGLAAPPPWATGPPLRL